jgi:hypothetical protein
MRMLVLLASLSLAGPASAADAPPFCADRPGLATGTYTAAAGTVQLESSFFDWASTRGGTDERVLLIGPSRLRLGIDDRTDVQLGWTPFIRTYELGADGRVRHSGVGDIFLFGKHRLTVDGAPFALALMPFVKVPVARRSIGNGHWEGGLLVPAELALSDPWSLTLTPEVDWNSDGGRHGYHTRFAAAASLGVALGARWSASLDGLVGREGDGDDTAREAAAGFAIAYLATPTLQFDLQADAGLARDTPDVQLDVGFALRF